MVGAQQNPSNGKHVRDGHSDPPFEGPVTCVTPVHVHLTEPPRRPMCFCSTSLQSDRYRPVKGVSKKCASTCMQHTSSQAGVAFLNVAATEFVVSCLSDATVV